MEIDTRVDEPIRSRKQVVTDYIIVVIAVALALFQLYCASYGVFTSYIQSSIHWTFIAIFIVLAKPLKGRLHIIDYLIIAAVIFLTVYLIYLQQTLITRAGVFYDYETWIAMAAIVIAIEAGRRVLGKILPIIVVVFLAYALFGSHLPGFFNTMNMSLKRVATSLFTSSEGLYGQTLFVSAQFIFLFVLFGSLLALTGAGEFFVDIAYSIAGKARGGPAQAAILASLLMGTINGSGAANVVTVGTFTIPLMKKVGLKPHIAAAIEACSSSGGQIMPPVMGAVAFLMSEITGISYGDIALAALVPALLYYITLSAQVYVNTRKSNIEAVKDGSIPKFWPVLRRGWLFLAPVVVLIYMLAGGYSPQISAFYAIVITLVVGFIKNRSKMTLKGLAGVCVSALKGIAPIAAACILAGGIMSVINLTGLGLKISGIIVQVSGGSLVIALLMSMIVSLILGMGLPTAASYLVLAALVAPALVKMGASMMGAHLFILYFGALSTITPPVALSTFAAAGIAGADIWQTGKEAVKLAASGFIIPFIFAFSPQLFLTGDPVSVVISIITAILGCITLAISLGGWFKIKLNIIYRILLFATAILMIMTNYLLTIVGVICTAVIFAIIILKPKAKYAA